MSCEVEGFLGVYALYLDESRGLMLWPNISIEAGEIICRLHSESRICFAPLSEKERIDLGKVMAIPLVTKIPERAHKTPVLLPVYVLKVDPSIRGILISCRRLSVSKEFMPVWA